MKTDILTEAIYRDPTYSISSRVEDLLQKITLEEKIAQVGSVPFFDLTDENELSPKKVALSLTNGIGQITRMGGQSVLPPQVRAKTANEIQSFLVQKTRLGIPAIIHEECCSGVMGSGATRFPQMIGLASTFSPELAEKMTTIIRHQMRSAGAHQGLAPVLDVLRDPRWGRVEETFGEDPTLIAQMGMAYVRGLQGEDLKSGVLATGKHFVAHSISEGGLNCTPVHIGLRELRDTFLMPFEAVIRETKLGSMMNSYSEMDGEPVAASRLILTEILRQELGFDGIVVSDYEAVRMLHSFHHSADSLGDAAAQALKAGIDVELPQTLCYGQPLVDAIANGKVSLEDLDLAVSRILTKKFELGLFENPFTDEAKVAEAYDGVKNHQTASQIAQKSMVLLKNDQDCLPLSREIKTIAVIGPNADQARCMMGDYSYPSGLEFFLDAREGLREKLTQKGAMREFITSMDDTTTILEAVQKAASPKTRVLFARGCDINSNDRSGFMEATRTAAQADVIILALGDKSGLNPDCTSGEFRDRTELGLPGIQEDLVMAMAQTGKPVVLVLVNGRPYDLSRVVDKSTAILEAWLPGEGGGEAIAEALFGGINPGGKLPVSLLRSVGQIPLFYNHKPSGGQSHFRIDYLSEKTTPLFPFGHGLSYTQFNYSDLVISAKQIPADGSVAISFSVQNTGSRSGDEVVQLYIQDEYGSLPRPVKELKGFKRVTLQPQESKKVTFNLKIDQLAFYNREMELSVEPGQIKVMVGSSSEDIRLNGVFEISGSQARLVSKRIFSCPVVVE